MKRAEDIAKPTSVGRQVRHDRPDLLAVANDLSRTMLEVDVELQATSPGLVAVKVSSLINGLVEVEGLIERNLVPTLKPCKILV